MSDAASAGQVQKERSLVILKPDAVQRKVSGEILRRLEQAGLSIVALKMIRATESLAQQHYRYEDIGARHGEKIWRQLIQYITEAPVIVAVLEGWSCVAVVRKLCGSTEPASAPPGTIRGDLAHHTYAAADGTGQAVQNLIHASATNEEAQLEISVWFDETEIHSW